MPASDAQNKADRHFRLQKLFEQPGQRLRTGEIATKLHVSDDTVKRDIDELDHSGRLPLRKLGQYWILAEHASIQQLQVRLSIIEATALYIAGRLLSQIHDEQNHSTIMALTKLIDALPKQLRPPQRTLIEMTLQRQENQPDRSAIFEALAIGWATQRKVTLLYAPAHKRKYSCQFSPYLLEPSGIGHTIYAVGKSDPPGDIRTYKLERIESAIVTDVPFTIDEDFDGPTLLRRAWGVMYGDTSEELITVRLRFSHYVTPRVKETLWHPTQDIIDTPEGCIMMVRIGDTLEIENWIRGWGSDCEVLEPSALRESIMDDVRRSARLYALPVEAHDTEDDDYASF